jgi:hypothetical protein
MTRNQKRNLRKKKRLLRAMIRIKCGKYANEKIAEHVRREWEL